MARLSITIVALSIIASVSAATTTRQVAVGDRIPDITVRDERGRPVSLRNRLQDKPTVVIFYRGGWCPYCTRHLSALADIEEELLKLGYQLIAISPDQPAKLKETPKRNELGYALLSDSEMAAAQALGIAYEVAPVLVAKYKNRFRIDLEAASGSKHHLLPHPTVLVIGTDGVVRFVHVNPDYKVRLEPAKIVSAARAAIR